MQLTLKSLSLTKIPPPLLCKVLVSIIIDKFAAAKVEWVR